MSAPSPQALIRPATMADAQGILDIYNEAVHVSVATADYAPSTLAKRQLWLQQHFQEGLAVLVAEGEGGAVDGWSALSTYIPRDGYRRTADTSVYVAGAAQGRGIGLRLMEDLIQLAHEGGFHSLIARVAVENVPSVRLHEKLGFTVVGELKEVFYKFDHWIDLYYMQLILEG